MSNKPDIFEYLDYRAFLLDVYENAKSTGTAMSYRYLSRRAGFSSPNFIKLVMDGKRNLGDESILAVAKAIDLNDEEAEFFASLVRFDQAQTSEQKNEAYQEVAASRRFRSARRIDHEMFEYLSHWYYPAIREMAARKDFKFDATWISTHLWPRVPVKNVRKALETLTELGLLVPDGDGGATRGDPSLTTGHEVGSLAIGNFHRQMMSCAADSIESVDRELRDISALTVCVPGELVQELKAEIHRFRERMLEICDSQQDGDTVYQMNIQLFPLTKAES